MSYEGEWRVMVLKKASEIGAGGSWSRMPEGALEWSSEQKTAWAVGVFSCCAKDADVEIKHINVDKVDKTYEKLEVHDLSPQVYAVVRGSVAVPVASEARASAVEFVRVDAGEAITVRSKVWHGGAVGVEVPASVVVVLRKGTTEGDTVKRILDTPVEFRS